MSRNLKHLAAYLRAADRRLIEGTKQGIHDLSESVILKTPVDTGALRANWNPSIDAPDTATSPFDDDAGSGAYAPERSAGSDRAVNRVRQMMKRAVGRMYYLSNGLHYAAKIEFGGSLQAFPAGMLRQTQVLAHRILSNAFREAAQRQIDKMTR